MRPRLREPASLRRVRVHALIALGLVAATWAVFFEVRDHEFVIYDDSVYILENPNLRDGLTVESVLRAFAEPYETNWIPLTWISLQADYSLYGPDPAGYHLTNVVLHCLSAVLLFFAFARMTGKTWPSAFVAAVFALHPLHVESVAWASERKDTLSGVFWMLGLLAYARYAERPGSPGRYLLVAVCLALGLLAKPMLVTLPFVLLLLDYWPLGRLPAGASGRLPDLRRLLQLALEKIPLLALAIAASVVTFAVQRSTGAMSGPEAVPLSLRIPNALDAYVVYLTKSLWPSGLAVFYPLPAAAPPVWLSALSALALASATALVLAAARTRPYLPVGWLWYLGTLVPVLGLVQVGMQARADRYMYVPLIGLSIMAAWGARDLLGRRRAGRIALTTAAVAALLALAGCARVQVGHWRDTFALFERAVAVTDGNFLAHHGLGSALLRAGRAEEAEAQYAAAVRLKPRWAGAHIGLADALAGQGALDAAMASYRRGLRIDPGHGRGHANYGKALADAGRLEEAIDHYRRALRPGTGTRAAQVHTLLGSALERSGDRAGAIESYREALRRDPQFAPAHAALGFALIHADRHAEAEAQLQRAVALGTESAELHAGLAEVGRRLGRPELTAHHYREALRLRPGWRHAANNLAWLLATDASESVRDPEEALRIAEATARATARADPTLLDTLAAAYAATGRFDAALATAGQAEELAAERGDLALAEAIRARIALYRAGRPYLNPAPPGGA